MRRAALALLLAACGSTETVEPADAEVILYVDTDAPVASSTGLRPQPDQPTPLFDRLRIEIFAPGATTPCEGCTNEFSLDADRLRALRVSVGIAPPVDVSGFRARVRMFLAAHAKAGEPDPDATVDVTVALPAVAEKMRTSVTVQLGTDDVGKRIGSLDAPIDPEPGAPAESRAGTWEKARRIPCSGAPREGEVCIPGGAYWMGGRRGSWSFLPGHDTMPPRLVALSPFYLDAHELTVKEFRSRSKPGDAQTWSGSDAGTSIGDFCTFTAAASSHDDFPVNCIPWATARAYCERDGRDLPSEAQWEYVASGLVGSTYVWGEDEPRCGDAIFARLGYGLFAGSVANCKPPSPPGGATTIGSGQRDRLVLPTGTVIDLMGNVTEWMADKWNRSNESCWKRPGIYVDPICASESRAEPGLRSARGGDWLVSGGQLAHTVRIAANATFISPEVGVRCARADTR
jgi:sulfatase modifying factor 1